MWSHPINASRLRCQSEKWADMGTFNTTEKPYAKGTK